MSKKPRIIVMSKDDDHTFDWMSDGWFTIKRRDTPEAQALMAKAKEAMEAGSNVKDVIKRLRKAGFTVVRSDDV